MGRGVLEKQVPQMRIYLTPDRSMNLGFTGWSHTSPMQQDNQALRIPGQVQGPVFAEACKGFTLTTNTVFPPGAG